MAKFIIKKHYISFPGEGYYSSFTDNNNNNPNCLNIAIEVKEELVADPRWWPDTRTDWPADHRS
jgi:hypothetical protein